MNDGAGFAILLTFIVLVGSCTSVLVSIKHSQQTQYIEQPVKKEKRCVN